jgi:hypothetical protein
VCCQRGGHSVWDRRGRYCPGQHRAPPQSHQDTASTSIDKSHAEGWHVAGRVTRPPSLDSSLVRALAGYLYSFFHSSILIHRIPSHPTPLHSLRGAGRLGTSHHHFGPDSSHSHAQCKRTTTLIPVTRPHLACHHLVLLRQLITTCNQTTYKYYYSTSCTQTQTAPCTPAPGVFVYSALPKTFHSLFTL